MKYAFSFLAVIALVVIAGLGSMIPGMQYLFGVAIPYLAIAVFLGGFVYRVVGWAKSPVPFSIQTTCGQGKSLDFIKHKFPTSMKIKIFFIHDYLIHPKILLLF